MFNRKSNPNKQGDIGMGLAISWFTLNDYTVSIPITDSQGYDLIVDSSDTLYRVFIRTTTRDKGDGIFEVGLRTQGGNYTQKDKSSYFDNSKSDLVFIACSDGKMFLIPSKDIMNSSSITVGSEKYRKFEIS